MTRRSLPGLGLTGGYGSGDGGWTDEMNTNLLTMSAVAQLTVESMTTTLPGSPTDGTLYIVPTAGANQWKVAVRDNGAWVYLTPKVGWEAWVKDVSKRVRWSGSAWNDAVVGAVSAKDEGSTVIATLTGLNFIGSGVTVSDAGGGVADVTIDGGGGGGGSGSEGAFTAPPIASTWTQQNFDATKTHLDDFTDPVAGVRLREDVYEYGNTNLLRAALKPIPDTTWDVRARMRRHTRMTSWNAFGLVVRDAASGRSSIIGFTFESLGIGTVNFSNDTTFSAQVSLGGNQYPWRSDFWLRLVYDGTDCIFYTSLDGVYWAVAKRWAATALFGFLTNPATHVGFGYNANNAGGGDLGNELDLLSWQLVSLA